MFDARVKSLYAAGTEARPTRGTETSARFRTPWQRDVPNVLLRPTVRRERTRRSLVRGVRSLVR
jgi:hypothetical protein